MTVVAVWNIEHYGAKGYGRLQDYSGIHDFVAAYQQLISANVIVIQEFKSPGDVKLTALAKTLGNDWSADWVKGALNQEVSPQTDPNSLTQSNLTWGSNSEGYALLFEGKAVQPLASKMSIGITGQHYMQLSTEGLDTYAIAGEGFNVITNSGFTNPTYFNVSSSPQLVMAPSKESTRLNIDYVARAEQALESIKLHGYARRPCEIRLADDTWLVAYHAPVDSTNCVYAVQLLAAAQSIARDGKVIVGGDFNVVGEAARKQAFGNLDQAGLKLFGGAVPPPSSVSFGKDDAEINSDNVNDFLGSNRDVLFSRGIGFTEVGVSHLLQILTAPSNAKQAEFAQAVVRSDAIKNMVSTNHPYGLPPNNPAWLQAWDSMKNEFGPHATHLTKPVYAAMLYRGYVSDHLPVMLAY